MIKQIIGIVLGFLLSVVVCNATLWDRGDGLIYDDVNDITWLQDMNYIVTSGYVDTLRRTSKLGPVTWKQATKFVSELEYEGWTDWRLPVSDEVKGFVEDGEMGSMYYTGLHDRENFTFIDGDGTLVSFLNPQSYGYWTSTQAAYGGRYKWTFNFSNGASDYVEKKAGRCVWPVMDGDVMTYNYLQFGDDVVYFGTDEVVF